MNTRTVTLKGMRRLLVATAGLLLACLAHADNAELVQKYIATFGQDTPTAQIDAAERLEWLGLSDTRIFDIAEKNLLANYKNEEKDHANYAAWMAKALAFSGQEKYRATLTEVANNAGNKNTRRHATTALDLLGQYTKWNAIISDTTNAHAGASVEVNGYANMLRSSEMELQRLAARRIYEEHVRDPWVLDLLENKARAAYAGKLEGREDADAASWLLKALAATGDAKYKPLLEDASRNATDKKVRNYAEKYLKSYY